MKKQIIITILIVLAWLCLWSLSADAAVVTKMEWNAVTTNTDGSTCTDLDGYKVYCTLNPPNYVSGQDMGNVLTFNLSAVTAMSVDGLYTCVVTAFDVWGNESLYSNSVKTMKHGSVFESPDTMKPSFPAGLILR